MDDAHADLLSRLRDLEARYEADLAVIRALLAGGERRVRERAYDRARRIWGMGGTEAS